MARVIGSAPTLTAFLSGEIMLAILGMLNSRAGFAGIGVVLLLLAFGYHKATVGLLGLEISGLKKDATMLATKVVEQQNLKKVCQVSLADSLAAISVQNDRIASLKIEADLRVAAATDQAMAAITPPDEVDRLIGGPAGVAEMNLFFIDLFGRGSQ